jgi:DNA-directed RNA polymerase specialized sigma24 family protein
MKVATTREAGGPMMLNEEHEPIVEEQLAVVAFSDHQRTTYPPQPDLYIAFVEGNRDRLRQAFIARFGVEVGCEATSDALAYAFEHWPRVSLMENPVGYLFRVGQSSARRQFRWSRPISLPPPTSGRVPEIEPGLAKALVKLSHERRVIVLLVHAHDWTYHAVAGFLDISVVKVRNELHRGLQQLRNELGKVLP